MSNDEQEALSRKYSNDLILLLPLKSGNVAVFNTARELCGIITPCPDLEYGGLEPPDLEMFQSIWYPPETQDARLRACAETLNDADVTINALKWSGLL